MTNVLSGQPALRLLSVRDGLGEWLNNAGLTGTGVEVGVLYGGFSEIILKKWRGQLCCVDPWINQDETIYHDGANRMDMNAVFACAKAVLGKYPCCKIYRAMSLNGSGYFRDGSLDFVYLDGNHAVGAVRDDLTAWWPKVKIGGLVCGHDFNTRCDNDTNSDAQTAVMELANVIGVYPHVTWCSSWWFIKTKEVDERFRAANIDGRWPKPVYTDNTKLDPVVVIPVARFDWNLAVKMLAWWAKMLGGQPNPHQVIAFCAPALTTEQRDVLDDSGLQNLSIVVQEGLKDVGYFGTPNQVIHGALEYCEKTYPGRAILWAEADCVPMRVSWVDEIMAEYRACGRPFMGDVYRSEGPGPLPHMTGNAVYHPGWRTIAPSLAALGSEECGWDTLCSHETLPRAHIAQTIQQIWRPPLPITESWSINNIRPSTALFHQCKDSSLIDVLCDRKGLSRIPLPRALCDTTYHTQKQTPAKYDFAPIVTSGEPMPQSPARRPTSAPRKGYIYDRKGRRVG